MTRMSASSANAGVPAAASTATSRRASHARPNRTASAGRGLPNIGADCAGRHRCGRPGKGGRKSAFAGRVPAETCGGSGLLALSPRDLDRGHEAREHQHVGGRLRHRRIDHVLVIGTLDHADAAAGAVAEAGEPRRGEAERAAASALPPLKLACAAAERVGTRRRFVGDLPDGDLEGGLFDAGVDDPGVGVEAAEVGIGAVCWRTRASSPVRCIPDTGCRRRCAGRGRRSS